MTERPTETFLIRLAEAVAAGQDARTTGNCPADVAAAALAVEAALVALLETTKTPYPNKPVFLTGLPEAIDKLSRFGPYCALRPDEWYALIARSRPEAIAIGMRRGLGLKGGLPGLLRAAARDAGWRRFLVEDAAVWLDLLDEIGAHDAAVNTVGETEIMVEIWAKQVATFPEAQRSRAAQMLAQGRLFQPIMAWLSGLDLSHLEDEDPDAEGVVNPNARAFLDAATSNHGRIALLRDLVSPTHFLTNPAEAVKAVSLYSADRHLFL